MPDLRELPISRMGPFKNELVAVIFNLCLTGEPVEKGLKILMHMPHPRPAKYKLLGGRLRSRCF